MCEEELGGDGHIDSIRLRDASGSRDKKGSLSDLFWSLL